MKNRRAVRAATIAGLIAGATAASGTGIGWADKPVPAPPFTIASSAWCGFLVQYSETADKVKTHIQVDGTVIVTGVVKAVLSNPADGKSLAVNISGPQFFGTVTKLTGPQLFLLASGDVGGAGIFLDKGNTTAVRDPNTGLFTSIVTDGNSSGNLCAQL